MDRTAYLGANQPTFSLPNGFFLSPGSGSLSENVSNNSNSGRGLKPIIQNKHSSATNNSSNNHSFPPDQAQVSNNYNNGSFSNSNNNYNTNTNPGHRLNTFQLRQTHTEAFNGSSTNSIPSFYEENSKLIKNTHNSPVQNNYYGNFSPVKNFRQNQTLHTDNFNQSQTIQQRQIPGQWLPNNHHYFENHQHSSFNSRSRELSRQTPPIQTHHNSVQSNLTTRDEQVITENDQKERYYSRLLTTSIIGILLYFIGSFLLIFVRDSVSGPLIVNLPSYSFTWELLFTNPGEYFGNLFQTVFGYFFQYARLFGFFPGLGNLTVDPVPRYLMPVDIGIKLFTILYFHLRWTAFDTKKFYKLGAFNKNYPFFDLTESATTPQDLQEAFEIPSINLPGEEIEKINNRNKLKNHSEKDNENYSHELNTTHKGFEIKSTEANYNDFDEEDDDGNDEILPFSGVQKPLEEWYSQNEHKIYAFIRKRILPGSNLVLVLYFSTLSVLDFRQPWFILWYVLGIMSMFWCMQTFLLVLDHNQYPPEDDEIEGEEN